MSTFSHLNQAGEAHMVDVSSKQKTARSARAAVFVQMIQAAKKCADLIPLCHPLPLSKVAVEIEVQAHGIQIETLCCTTGRTGVEMEALTAASVAALTIYDMCKAFDKSMVIENLRLLEKTGGKSGDWQRD